MHNLTLLLTGNRHSQRSSLSEQAVEWSVSWERGVRDFYAAGEKVRNLRKFHGLAGYHSTRRFSPTSYLQYIQYLQVRQSEPSKPRSSQRLPRCFPVFSRKWQGLPAEQKQDFHRTVHLDVQGGHLSSKHPARTQSDSLHGCFVKLLAEIESLVIDPF